MSDPDPDFDSEAYLILNPDVAAGVSAGAIRSPYEHWVRQGRAEGRLSRLPASQPDFDEAAYLQLNPDVADALRAGGIGSGREHWMRYGQYDGRVGGVTPPEGEREHRLAAARRKRFGVNYYGFQSVISGLGAATRAYTAAFQARAIRVNEVEVAPWPGRFPYDHEVERVVAPYRIHVIHQNADMTAFFMKKYGGSLEQAYKVGLWVWELAAARPEWHRASRQFDEIWAPSDFCRCALANISGVPVYRVPYAVSSPEPRGDFGRSHFGIPENAFVFLYAFDVASFIERKNPLALIRAFRRAFGESTQVALVMKYLNTDRNPEGVEAMRALAGQRNILMLEASMNSDEMAALRRHADCFVSPHRAEGFGLNIAEAMYLGKPVIATGYSGNMDFSTEETSFLIDYDLVGIPSDIGPYAKGMPWAEPSIQHLAVLLRTVFENREAARAKGARAAQLIRRDYSPNAVGRMIDARLAAAGVPDRGPMRFARLAAAAAYRWNPSLMARVFRAVR